MYLIQVGNLIINMDLVERVDLHHHRENRWGRDDDGVCFYAPSVTLDNVIVTLWGEEAEQVRAYFRYKAPLYTIVPEREPEIGKS